MFDPSIWTEARSVLMLSEIFTACGCSTERTICSRAQPTVVCRLKNGSWIMSDVKDTEQWDSFKGGKKSKTCYFTVLHASFSCEYCLLSFFLDFFFCLSFSHPFAFARITLFFFFFYRPEIRFEQAEPQRQWHDQRADCRWVYLWHPATKSNHT